MAAALVALFLGTNAGAAGAWVLTPDGYGPLKIGMTKAAALKAWGAPFGPERPSGFDGCEEFLSGRVRGLLLRFEDGRLAVITIFENRHIPTSAGVRIGDTEAVVRRRFASGLVVKPHEYDEPPAHYLTVYPASGHHGFKFSTDSHGVVDQIDSGGSSIKYVEGCL